MEDPDGLLSAEDVSGSEKYLTSPIHSNNALVEDFNQADSDVSYVKYDEAQEENRGEMPLFFVGVP